MKEQLVITALGVDRPGIVDELSQVLRAQNLNIEDSRMSVLGGEFAIMLLVSGAEKATEAFLSEKGSLEASLQMQLLAKTTSSKRDSKALAPYNVEVVAIDHPGIVHDIARFFSSRKINIVDLDTQRYAAAHTGTPMFAIHMILGIPEDQSIAKLRDEFLSLCDELNLDGKISATT